MKDPARSKELADLARDLGIDPAKDEHLVWAVKDMDETPLPEHWCWPFAIARSTGLPPSILSNT
jgi:hypothetical protein